VRWDPAQGGASGSDAAGSAQGSVASRRVVAALTTNGLGGGGPDDNLAQAGHLVPLSLSLANSSRMQEVASTVTVGTGVRYDPDTESLVVLSRTGVER
jgi:hypothetical protein